MQTFEVIHIHFSNPDQLKHFFKHKSSDANVFYILFPFFFF